MSTTTPLSRIARPTIRLREIRPSILAVPIAILADALTTVKAVSIMGLAFEAGPLASLIIEWLWRTTAHHSLGEVAGWYAVGYVAVGIAVAGALHLGNEHIRAAPGGRWFAPMVAAVFVLSSAINLAVLAKWVAWVPGAGWS